MQMNIALKSLELAVDEIKKTDNQERIAEANNILQVIWSCKEQLNDGAPFVDIDDMLNEVAVRINQLMENPNSAGKHDQIAI